MPGIPPLSGARSGIFRRVVSKSCFSCALAGRGGEGVAIVLDRIMNGSYCMNDARRKEMMGARGYYNTNNTGYQVLLRTVRV